MSSQSGTHNPKKKKSKCRNKKLMQFTTHFEKENYNSNYQKQDVNLNDNVESHLNSFVSDIND